MSSSPSLSLSRKILSRSEMSALTEAGEYLSALRKLHSTAQTEIGAARDEAQKQGYAAGYAEGRQAALADLAKAIAEIRSSLATSDNELIGIVMTAVTRIIGEIDAQELARRCLRKALEDAADEIWAIVRVSPQEHAMFLADVQALPLTARHPEVKSVEADPLLNAGEIVIETPKGRIHAGLRQQLSRLQAGLEEARG